MIGKGKMAKKEKDHKELADKGWSHEKPKKDKKATEGMKKKSCGCGQDPCITYGVKKEGNKFSKALKIARDKDDDEMELDGKKIPVTEFVLSLFDRETGQFPKGETAVLTAIEKDYGEQYINPAKAFIERIMATYEQYTTPQEPVITDEQPAGTVMEPTVAQDEEMEESGLQYYTGVKKHGKEYMKKAAQAGRDGASQEELGRLKDKYSKAEKDKTTKEAQDIMRLAGL